MRIVLVSNTTWYLYNFRRGFIRQLIALGHEVTLYSPRDDYAEKAVAEFGCRHRHLEVDSKGSNPVRDFLTFAGMVKAYREIRPDLVFHNTIKPNIYGSLAASFLGIPYINTITGLGTVFLDRNARQGLVRMLYRISQARASWVFFQNRDDQRIFLSGNLVSAEKTSIIPGSGVDLARFSLSPLPEREEFRIALIARMLRTKGVEVFVNTARQLKRRFPKARFQLIGFVGVDNPDAISREEMDAWVKEGCIEYLGATDNVASAIAETDAVVLPSYYPEGVPKTLLEACAVGRPIIATDVPGCREVVMDGINGFICEPKSVDDLADKITRLMETPFGDRVRMAENGRRMVEEKYDEQMVIRMYLDAMSRAGV